MRARAHLVLDHLRRQWMGALALFLVLTGGVAYAANTIASGDIIDGEVKTADLGANAVNSSKLANGQVQVADLGQGAVATDELANGQVKAADIGDGEVKSAEIANGQVQTAEIGANQVRGSHLLDSTLTGGDVANNALKGADIDEATLDVGDAARAYAAMNSFLCPPPQTACSIQQEKGISSITRIETGVYCVIAPGIESSATPAAVTVDWNGTEGPEGNTSAMSDEGFNLCPSADGFLVRTFRLPTTSGTSAPADNVGFTIVIP
jgi:hypothetical protein